MSWAVLIMDLVREVQGVPSLPESGDFKESGLGMRDGSYRCNQMLCDRIMKVYIHVWVCICLYICIHNDIYTHVAQTSPCQAVSRRFWWRHLIRPSIYDKYSGSMKITIYVDHVSRCKTASVTTWTNRWTYRVFVMNDRCD